MLSTNARKRALWVVIYMCVAALVLCVVGMLAAVRNTQLEGTPTGQKLLAASDRILDCTEPDGQCFKDSQRRTAKAVGDINRVVVLAAACSVGLSPRLEVDERQAAIQQCVIQRLSVKP
jgi:hypothetical protein